MLMYVNWNVDPVFLNLGVIELRYYSCLFALGIFIGYNLVAKLYKLENIPQEKVYSLFVYAVLGIVIGARLGHCLFYDWDYFSKHPLEIILPFKFQPGFKFVGYQGLASHGGTMGVLIALYLYSKKYKLNYLGTIDKVAIVAPLTGAFIRFGNLMNSEIIGKESTAPFAFIFKRIDFIPRHPSQLYEALAYLFIFIVLWILFKALRNRVAYGFFTGLAIALIFLARFFIEFTKEYQVGFEDGMFFNMGQLLSIPFVIIGIGLAVFKWRSSKCSNVRK